MGKLTIITISFNHREGLQRTIDSIVNQTFSDYEWIVVDGGSADGSKELIEQYQSHFAWWCSEPDKGVYNAMNKGITQSKGEYINFMNAGDVFATPTILAEIFSKPHEADVLYGRMVVGTINGEEYWTNMMKPRLRWFDFYSSTLNHQSTFTKREMFIKYGNFDESYRVYGDWRHFAQIIGVEKATSEYIPKIISIYEGGGLSATQEEACKQELARLRQEVYPTFNAEIYRLCNQLDLVFSFKFTKCLFKVLFHGSKFLTKIIHK